MNPFMCKRCRQEHIGECADVAALLLERDELKAKWDYYQEFCKAHGATSITNLVVQRDELVAALTELLQRAENFHACDVKFSDFEAAKVAMDSARAAIAKART